MCFLGNRNDNLNASFIVKIHRLAEDRRIILFRNVDIFLVAYTASQTRETVMCDSFHALFPEVFGYKRLKAKPLVIEGT